MGDHADGQRTRHPVYPDGAMFLDDVAAGDLWLFPAGAPHSIQALGDDGCEFLLVFNQGDFSEESTLLLSDWLKHTPPEILQHDFGGRAPAAATRAPPRRGGDR